MKLSHLCTGRSWGRAWLFCAWIFCLAAASLSRADTIELASGARHDNCQVLKAQWDSVQFKSGNGPAQTVTGQNVAMVLRDSPLLQSPRSKIEAGNFTKAIEELKAIAAAPVAKDSEWQKAEAEFLLGRAYRGLGNLDEAVSAYKKFIEAYTTPKDWFVPHAVLEHAETLLLDRKPGTAEPEFRRLAQFGGHWAIRAKLGEAMAALARSGATEAAKVRKLTDEVVRNRESPPSLKNQALVVRAKALLLQKNPKQAITELTEGFFSSTRTDIDYSYERAEATLLMGKAHLLDESRESHEQAEIWFLRVPALYKRHGGLYADACEELVTLYEKAGNQDRARDWRARKSGAAPAPAAPAAEKAGEKPEKKAAKASPKASK